MAGQILREAVVGLKSDLFLELVQLLWPWHTGLSVSAGMEAWG